MPASMMSVGSPRRASAVDPPRYGSRSGLPSARRRNGAPADRAARRGTAGTISRTRGPARHPVAERGLPLQRGGLQHHAAHQVGVALGQEQRDRPAHRVADGDDRPHAELADERGGVVGGVLEGERLVAAQAPPVAPVVDGDERSSARPARS